MYIINDIAYAGENKQSIKVKSVRAIEDYKLQIKFNNDEIRIFDFECMLDFPVYKPLKDKEVFNSAYVDFNTVVWNNGEIDIAPEKLYQDSILINNTKTA